MDTALDDFWGRTEVRQAMDALLDAAFREDGVLDDVATRLAFGDATEAAVARITAEEPGVVCGALGALAAFERLARRACG